MNEYIFLYFISFIGVLFAVVQDLRSREIANWLTFSLLTFVLAYRAFYSIYSLDFMFFLYGLGGILLFTALGHLFYYSKIFAGGDAKLLFGLGGILPYYSINSYIYLGLGFILMLFAGGVAYTLIYSSFLARKNHKTFKKSFNQQLIKKKYLFILSILIAAAILFINTFDVFFVSVAAFILFSPLLFAYVKAIELSCMVKFVSPYDLTEGDWLERDIKLGKKKILKNFKGLTYKEILLLRKEGKKVLIKNGVPFAPAFLIALAILFFVLRYSSTF